MRRLEIAQRAASEAFGATLVVMVVVGLERFET